MATPPLLAVFSASSQPSIASFIRIKKRFGESIGVAVDEYAFEETISEEQFIKELQSVINTKKYTGVIVQLPLPKTFNSQKVLDTIPSHLDVDVLSTTAWSAFINNGKIIPPVAGAIAHILKENITNLHTKNIVVVGQGKLVGVPVTAWLTSQGLTPTILDITTDEDTKLTAYKKADIVITGIGVPHHLKQYFFKLGVVMIDAGTSELSGVLLGDCDPLCETISSIFTPVPGGLGPLTVAYLFKNLIELHKTKHTSV